MNDNAEVEPTVTEMTAAVTRAITVARTDQGTLINNQFALAALLTNVALVMSVVDDKHERRRMLKEFMHQVEQRIAGIRSEPGFADAVRRVSRQ